MALQPRSVAALLCLNLTVLGFGQNERPEDPYIYLIHADDCVSGSASALTGFVLEAERGIVTALHGVVGCDSVTASNDHAEEGLKVIEDLTISAVDFKHDVALLTSEVTDTMNGGLPWTVFDATSSAQLSAVGHPAGQPGQRRAGATPGGSGQIYPLYELIPPSLREAAEGRKSPDIYAVDALTLQNVILPGYSGAPVFADDQVVAIAQGGTSGGREGWAMLWDEIELAPVEGDQNLESELVDLASNTDFVMSSLFGVRETQLPTFKNLEVYDENADHRYEYERYTRPGSETFEADMGHIFTGAYSIDAQKEIAVRGLTVNVQSGSDLLEVSWRISAGPSLAGSDYVGQLDAVIKAEQIPVPE